MKGVSLKTPPSSPMHAIKYHDKYIIIKSNLKSYLGNIKSSFKSYLEYMYVHVIRTCSRIEILGKCVLAPPLTFSSCTYTPEYNILA